MAETAVHPHQSCSLSMLSCIIILCKLVSLILFMNVVYIQGTRSPRHCIFIFRDFLKSSEDKKAIKCWWAYPLSMQHCYRKNVLSNHELCLLVQKDMYWASSIYISLYSYKSKAGFKEGFLAFNFQKCLHYSAK